MTWIIQKYFVLMVSLLVFWFAEWKPFYMLHYLKEAGLLVLQKYILDC